MTKDEIKALYDECYKKSLVGATMQYINGGNVTTHGAERALKKDAEIWQDVFFKQFFTGEDADIFAREKALQQLCENLFRNAFVFGASFVLYLIDNIKPEPVFNTTLES